MGGRTHNHFSTVMEDKSNLNRLVFLKVTIVAGFLLLLTTLLQVQIYMGGYYRDLAEGNRIKEVPIHAARGIIFDRNGVALVSNSAAFRFNKNRISKDQAIALEAKGELPEQDSYRAYLFGPALAHVLGYVDGEGNGQGGVEEKYDRVLRGKDGKQLVEVDAQGKSLRAVSTIGPETGNNITLTIDAQLQREAASLIEGKKGAVVVSDPQTGEILVLASSPSFNPEQVADYLTSKDQPFFNRAISGVYPPGSTFKIVTATAGLETGKITEKTTIDDPGILIIGSYKFPNWLYLRNRGTQGTLNVVSALQKSNDIFFYRVGEWVGVDQLSNWAAKFGLGNALGIDLPGEAAGIIRSKTEWYLGDTYHLAIGQGDLLVTPLQVNAWTNVIANGGKLCRPYAAGKINCKDLGISKSTLNLVKGGLVAACKPGGTAWPLFGMDVACKTGTAEFGDPRNRTHAWLTAFAPVEKPQIAVTVLVEGGGEGSDVAAPIVKKILEQYMTP